MSIRNFALIEQMNISFNDGITIFTGETGAGKSILMDAFSILLGERASSEFIRHGKDSFVIDGIFGNNTYNACINVRRKAEGNITYLIQAMLVCHSFDIDADGIFGPATENAVKDFQSRNGLSVDGIVGKNTFNKLFK